MSKISSSKLTDISQAASELILAISGNHPDIRSDDDRKIVPMYDALNDDHAHPAIVKAMADDLLNCRNVKALTLSESDSKIIAIARLRGIAPASSAVTAAQLMADKIEELEARIRKMTCNHGYPPGAHTMGKTGCVDCCGRDAYIWDHAHLPGKHVHNIATFNEQYLTQPITKPEGEPDDA